MTHALVNVPAKAKRGEIIEIKTMISHPMETGYRRDEVGKVIPREIFRRFTCTYNGVEVFRADRFEEVLLSDWLAHSPIDMVAETFNLDRSVIAQFPKNRPDVLPV